MKSVGRKKWTQIVNSLGLTVSAYIDQTKVVETVHIETFSFILARETTTWGNLMGPLLFCSRRSVDIFVDPVIS